jgi:hypothetical protein
MDSWVDKTQLVLNLIPFKIVAEIWTFKIVAEIWTYLKKLYS